MSATAPITVVIPVRDGAMLLREALRSVLGQSVVPSEVIGVDDHSGDDPGAAVAEFPPATLLRSPGFGAAAARNHGAAHAAQPWLAFLDADDLWPPERCARQMEFVQASPGIDLVAGAAMQFRVDANGAFEPLGEAGATRLPTACLVRREAFLRVGGFSAEFRLGETIEWWSRAVDAGLACASIPDTVLWRRVHESNLGRTTAQPGKAYLDMLHAVLQRRRGSGLG